MMACNTGQTNMLTTNPPSTMKPEVLRISIKNAEISLQNLPKTSQVANILLKILAYVKLGFAYIYLQLAK